jgi:hypothetical protein
MPVDAQRLGGVLDPPRPQDQPVGDQRFHEPIVGRAGARVAT